MDANVQELDAYAMKIIGFKARQLVGKAGFRRSDKEDIEQELAFDLLRRSSNFDPTRAGWKTFVTCVVERRTATMLEDRIARTRDYRKEAFSLNEMVNVDDHKEVERGATIDANVVHHGRAPEELHLLALDVQTVLDSLPRGLRKIAQRLKTETVSDIARELGVSRKQIYRSVWEIRQRFEDAGLRGYLR